jgi:hypothetical protein
LSILNLTDRSTKKEGQAMMNLDAKYEVKGGTLFVNGESVPLRKGLIYAALARAGWKGIDGPISRELFEKVIEADRRISIVALAIQLESSAA